MALSTSTSSATFQNVFSTLTIIVYVGTDTSIPATDVPSVSASYTDPGITVTPATGQIQLSGVYQSIIPVTWYWKDLTDTLKSGPAAPASGTYLKIVQVDSPAFLTTACIYTVTSSAGVDVFTHTVTLGSYDVIKTALTLALAGQP
jgi:hypothetical protein